MLNCPLLDSCNHTKVFAVKLCHHNSGPDLQKLLDGTLKDAKDNFAL